MKLFFPVILVVIFFACSATRQSPGVTTLQVTTIPLPKELSDPDKQFSGLFIYSGQLWLLPECRLQENQEAALYVIPLQSLDDLINNKATNIDFKKIPVEGLSYMRSKMQLHGQQYEGLEALVLNGNSIYISVETNTPSTEAYLIKGKIFNDRIMLDTSILFPLQKPLKEKGVHIYNAGFEAMSLNQNKLHCFFEYNSFKHGNFVYSVDTSLNLAPGQVPLPAIPFRVSDITMTGNHDAAAINYFYNGSGKDEVYRPSKEEAPYQLVHDSSNFFSYSRLINIHFTSNEISWSVKGEFPRQYWQYNWEGIAAYKSGYFLINDKYTSSRPYQSVLLFVKP
jgi:hypothetical protein